MIGEVPEAIIPLDKLRDERFLERLGMAGGVRGGGDVYVSFNVQTPDVASFRASQTQIMTQAAVAIDQSRRNL